MTRPALTAVVLAPFYAVGVFLLGWHPWWSAPVVALMVALAFHAGQHVEARDRQVRS